jgi:hypothetical protein
MATYFDARDIVRPSDGGFPGSVYTFTPEIQYLPSGALDEGCNRTHHDFSFMPLHLDGSCTEYFIVAELSPHIYDLGLACRASYWCLVQRSAVRTYLGNQDMQSRHAAMRLHRLYLSISLLLVLCFSSGEVHA